jgi:sec-independent protein translocase protein TatA
MGGFQPIHIVIIVVVLLVLFGGAKIPQFMRGLGQGTSEFKKGLDEGKTVNLTAKPDEEAKSTEKV